MIIIIEQSGTIFVAPAVEIFAQLMSLEHADD